MNIVLIEPEIPQNTGTIGRLCLATGFTLHLVKPLGFSLEAHHIKRAGLDYWEHLNVVVHESSEHFFNNLESNANVILIETRAGKTIYEHQFQANSFIVFGKETTGLADWILEKFALNTLRIPMWDARVRSLNLSNSVSIVAYEAIRQLKYSEN